MQNVGRTGLNGFESPEESGRDLSTPLRFAQDDRDGVCVASVLRPLKRTVVSGEQVKGASACKCVEA